MLLSKEDTDYSSCKIHISQKILLKYLETFSRHVQKQAWPISNIVHPSDSHLPVRLDNDGDRASKNQSPSAQGAIAPAAALKVVLTFSQSPFNLPKKKKIRSHVRTPSQLCTPIMTKPYSTTLPSLPQPYLAPGQVVFSWIILPPSSREGQYCGRKNLEAPVREA